MAERIEHFNVVAPADTPLPSYVVTAITFPPGMISEIQVHIPGGHRGRAGFQLFYGSAQLIPRTDGGWLKGNRKTFTFPLDDPFPGGTGWFTGVYNSGKYDHIFELSLAMDNVVASLVELPPVLLLRSAGALTTEGGAVPVQPSPGNGGGGGPVPV